MNKKRMLTVAGLGLAQLMISQVANAQTQDSLQLKDVVISATKNNQKQSQTGKVVTVISKEVLEHSAGKSLSELLSEQAGIIIAGSGSNPGKNKDIFLRGAGVAYTLILIDGIVVGDPSSIASSFDLRLINIDQIERIEILKGGQSTIYGSDAVAGVINIITKKDGKKGNNVSGIASYGSYNTFKGSIGLNSKVDVFSYNINYTHNSTDGISEAIPAPNDATVFDKDGFKQDALNANFSLQADKNLTINPFIRYSAGTFKYDDGSFSDANNVSTLKHVNGGLNAQYLLGKAKFNLNASLENSTRDYKTAFTWSSGQYQGKQTLVDLFYNQDLSEKVNLLVGVDNRTTKIISAAPIDPKANLFSTYASLFLHDLSVFNLELGGRYNKHDKYGENFTYSITPSVNIVNHVKVFGTISTSFKAPTLDMMFGMYGANPNLKPEKSDNYEVGTRINLADNKFTLRIVGFKRNLTNAIVYATQGYINQDNQKDKGFEIEPAFKFNKIKVTGYYAYVDGKNETTDFLLRRPKNTIGANVGALATENLYLSANFRRFGKRIDANFDPVTYAMTYVDIASYNLVDFYAEYALLGKRIKLFADLKNILNKKYTELYGYSTMGFNVNGGISFKFN
jgi:vitamin B12 transporter